MIQNRLIAVMALLLTTCVYLVGAPISAMSEPDSAAYSKCLRACQECSRACNLCHKHCLAMATSGNKAHAASAALSADCMDVCTLTAGIVARKGPLTRVVCEACVKACDACGAECGKSPEMAPMAKCKKSCGGCSAACKALMAGM